MSDRSSVVEEIEFVARSMNRVEMLETLRMLGGATRDELRSELSASRTTVTRNLDALCDRGWVRATDREYALTPGAEAVVERFLDLESTVATARRLRPFFEHTSREAFDVELSALADASLTVAKPEDPWAMVNAHVKRLRSSTDDRMALPLVGLHAVEAVHEKVVDGDANVELVVTDGVVETLFSDPEYAPLTTEMLDTGRFRVSRTDDAIPFYLGLLDGTVQVGVDEDGEPRALLESEDPTVRDWARERLQELFDASVPVDADSVGSGDG